MDTGFCKKSTTSPKQQKRSADTEITMLRNSLEAERFYLNKPRGKRPWSWATLFNLHRESDWSYRK